MYIPFVRVCLQWVGMGNKELLEYFKEYNPMRPRHAYGPQGHRGMSILMFAESPTGYHDAQRLDKHFRDARRGRDPWKQHWEAPLSSRGRWKTYPIWLHGKQGRP